MEVLGICKGEVCDMVLDGKGCICLEYIILSCGLIGFCNDFMIMILGIGLFYLSFSYYDDVKLGEIG